MDKFKELSVLMNGVVRRQDCYDMNFGKNSYRKIIANNYGGYKIRVDDFEDLFFFKIVVESKLSFSINNPEKIYNFDKPIYLDANFPYKIYACGFDYNPFSEESFNVFWNDLVKVSADWSLKNNECVFFYNNYVGIALQPARDSTQIISDAIELIASNGAIFKNDANAIILEKNFPKKLQSLLPLMIKYGISDDSERHLLAEQMRSKEKEKLVEKVVPLMQEINSYLNSFNHTQLTSDAIALGKLAEFVSEIIVN